MRRSRRARAAYVDDQQVIDGSAAVGIAALRARLIDNPGRTVVLSTGCNIDMGLHRRIIGGEDVDLAKEAEQDSPTSEGA